MKAITWKTDEDGSDRIGAVIYLFADSTAINVESNRTVIGDPEELIISDCNSDNITVHTGVTDPGDYWGWKYNYDGSSLSSNTRFKGNSNLTSALDDSATTVPVETSLPFVTSGGTVQIGDEKITYTGVTSTSLTGCTRGASSTTAASHSQNDNVKQV